MKETEGISGGFGLTIEFSKDHCLGNRTGLFSEIGLVRMLEASDYNSVDQVSPFFGAITDSFRKNVFYSEVTKVSTLFVELLRAIHRYNRDLGWTENNILAI